MSARRVVVLGSTGSVGTQTLDVIGHLNALHRLGQFPVSFEVVGLAARHRASDLLLQAEQHGVGRVAICDEREAGSLRSAGRVVICGPNSAHELVESTACDLVVAAMVGEAGLPATLAAVSLGRDVLLANKETLVAAGSLVLAEAKRTGSKLLPLDSEHGAAWQCLSSECPGECPPFAGAVAGSKAVGRGLDSLRCLHLTASGGPFRQSSADAIEHATVDMALSHPTWRMGPKVTIDSATMMNKSFEVVEAHWLFGLQADRIGVLVHPQSIVHAIAEYVDGSWLAHLGSPDMRCPIQHALSWPLRTNGQSKRLNLAELGRLEFTAPDHTRFPALALSRRVIEEGGTSGTVLNRANEIAVEAFLAGRIPFGRIARVAQAAMDAVSVRPLTSLDDVAHAGQEAQEAVARELLQPVRTVG